MKKLLYLLSLLMFLTVFSCEDESDEVSAEDETAIEVDPSLFIADGLSTSITTEQCTLSDGTVTTCYRITTTSIPSDHDMGPWCPKNITDSKDAGGIWFEDGQVYDVDGAFIENMATFYSDANWLMYNEDGTIHVTETLEACQAAARPNVDPAYQNFCVECQPSYFDEGNTLTYLIPVKPVKLSSSQSITGMGIVVGVAFNGVNFDPPAPTQSILGNYTLAPMDDCGGHVNLASGYHYHAATGCTKEVTQTDGHAPMIGYALDGYGMYAQFDEDGNEPTDLDECRGHTDETRGYHYHVAGPGTNSFIGCFKGAQGSFSVN